ncbi:MAG: hypothetical protein KatS3mg131_3387 [Candidatus Tectimicrobiota bacterium]|nr:MAG: hypothetical protein KatS3mg131_3387 [Candidatus Tectomicrobia bacterium]
MQLDVATQDPRNINPLAIGDSPIYIYDPATGEVQAGLLEQILEAIPVTLVQYRLYTTRRELSAQLAGPASRYCSGAPGSPRGRRGVRQRGRGGLALTCR